MSLKSVIVHKNESDLHECQNPTQKLVNYKPMSTRPREETEPHHAFAADKLLKTANLNVGNIKEWAILNSWAKTHFLVANAPSDDIRVATNPLTV